jgi:hypothetical protein
MIDLLTGLALATGCGVTCAPPPTQPPSAAELRALLREVAAAPTGAHTDAIDALLFVGPHTRAHLDAHPGLLPESHEAWLRDELARQTVKVAFRLQDDTGVLASGEASVPLGRKQHLELDGGLLGPLSVSGSVKRVGLHHLWTRW